jgi:hypothetical protein
MELLLCNEAEQAVPLLDAIEQELMPAFAGLLRRSEHKGDVLKDMSDDLQYYS